MQVPFKKALAQSFARHFCSSKKKKLICINQKFKLYKIVSEDEGGPNRSWQWSFTPAPLSPPSVTPLGLLSLNLTKLYWSTRSLAFSAKKNDINTGKFLLHHSSSTFFEFTSSLLLEYGC